jgi:hypothetical protein
MTCTRIQAISLGFATVLAFCPFSSVFAQGLDNPQGAIEVTNDPQAPAAPAPTATPRVGRKAAEKYMAPRTQTTTRTEAETESAVGPDDHFLAVHLGGFIDDTAYKWGRDEPQKKTGNFNIGVTYRMGEWVNSMDLAGRAEYTTYTVDGKSASKLTFMPVITFPDAAAKFPLYFGAGLGLGIFTNQLGGESPISLDYSLFLGTRFFDIFRNVGFFLEFGIKNHLFLSSDGQFNGLFVAMGPAFTF